MHTISVVLVTAMALAASPAPQGSSGPASSASAPSASTSLPSVAEILGVWAGTVTHDGESQPVALHFEPEEGKVKISLSMPVIHLDKATLGGVDFVARNDSVLLGPFKFRWDASARTLNGIVPRGLIPVYEMPLKLSKVDGFDVPSRGELSAPLKEPAWTFDAGSPVWAGPSYANDLVYVGGQDGWVYAIDAKTGAKKWAYQTGGAIRTRPTIAGDALYVQADDGYLYRLAAKTGAPKWKTKIVDGPIVRLPFSDPKSRFDRFGSDVAVAGNRLYVGTHDGKVLALDPVRGEKKWEFASGDAVLAAPAVFNGRIYFGSFDKSVYALDAATGKQLWKRDTQGAVVSTPAIVDGKAVVGNRCYDLLGLDLATGDVSWKRYVWMSWVESSPAVKDGIAYVGSSDAAIVFAVDPRDGRRVWSTDVHGWAWGQPAVSDTRVYAGTASQVKYLANHTGNFLALDRASGAVAWRYAFAAPDSGSYGSPGSPALGGGRVFATGLDGKVYAFEP